jgi:putative ABC transport system permease protein
MQPNSSIFRLSNIKLPMLLNYLIIGFRNLRKHFSFSIINIVGLGLGLATCLLLVTWILNELSFDRFHAHSNRIYRAGLDYSFGGQASKNSVSPTALLPEAQKNFAEIESGVRVYNPSFYNPFIVRQSTRLFEEKRFYYADSTFFKIFSFKLISGTPEHALVQPNSVVLTQRMARKYFGDQDPMGKSLRINDGTDYTVTGVMEDVPNNSFLQFDFMASFSSLDASKQHIWWSANYQTFFLVAPNTDIPQLQDKINNLVKRELASELTNPNDYVRYPLMRLTDIYLRSDVSESEITSSINYIYGFGAIALLILLIACINYINLATAKAADRAKEVSIRKVVGAGKKQLFFQFIGESLTLTFLAFLLAYLLAFTILPVFNSVTGKHFPTSLLTAPSFLLLCFGALLIIGICSGAYPAFAITALKPATVLKGNFKSSGKGIWLRQSLVVFQFSISIILIVGTIVILKQVNFIQNVRLGYDKENIIILPLDRKTSQLYGRLRQQLINSGVVSQVGRATESPSKIGGGYSLNIIGQTGDKGMIVTAMNADTTFIPALGMDIIAGRNFNDMDVRRYRADTTVAFIVNESTLKEVSISREKAIGVRVNLNGRKGEIIGVVKDFHFTSLHSAIGPLVLFNEENQLSFIFVKIKPGNLNSSLATIQSICLTTLPHRPFEYEFLDQQYSGLYSAEQRIGTIITIFAALAILIASLGLLGLVSFSASQRTKEIGIRKVMGATAASIVLLITGNYTRLIIISILIGLPIAWWTIDHLFLSSFVYRAEIGIWPYVLAGIACILVSFATASFQAIKAALVNPADTLRNE